MEVVVIAIWKYFFKYTFQKYVSRMFPTDNIWIVKIRINHIKDPEDLWVVEITNIKILELTQLGCLQEQHRVCMRQEWVTVNVNMLKVGAAEMSLLVKVPTKPSLWPDWVQFPRT